MDSISVPLLPSSVFIPSKSPYSNKHFKSLEGHSRNRDLTSHQSERVCMIPIPLPNHPHTVLCLLRRLQKPEFY